MITDLPPAETIAFVVQGEAGLCCEEAQIAAVHVLRNRARLNWIVKWNDGWSGWQHPTPAVIKMTIKALEMPDITEGGIFLFSRQDVEKLVGPDGIPKVQWLFRYEPGKRFACPGEGKNEWVEVWKPRGFSQLG